ncbi:hypothetical protein EBT11_01280 [bacterium]|nr:hypothetical protein [bacterium]
MALQLAADPDDFSEGPRAAGVRTKAFGASRPGLGGSQSRVGMGDSERGRGVGKTPSLLPVSPSFDQFGQVLHRVWEKAPETRVVVTGSGSRREIARQADLLSLAQDGRVQNFFDPLPMARFAALLRASQLHVGLDSGVLHLAMALGKPTVSLFRESVGRPGWEPRGAAHQIILRSCECAEAGQQKCSGGRALCLSRISPDEVARLVSESLNSTRTSG